MATPAFRPMYRPNEPSAIVTLFQFRWNWRNVPPFKMAERSHEEGTEALRSSTAWRISSSPKILSSSKRCGDIFGLDLNPPDRALVLCVDEKGQAQALNRTQPILPLAPGVPARQSHDSERNGVTSLFAALNVATGFTISNCYRRHRHKSSSDF